MADERPAHERSAPKTVLVVEDDPPVRAFVARVLSERGYRVLRAASGAEALEHVIRQTGPVHLVIADIVLPAMRGSEVASRVRALHPGIPVLFMTGYEAADVLPGDAPAPGDRFLPKPFGPATLLSNVRALIGEPSPAS